MNIDNVDFRSLNVRSYPVTTQMSSWGKLLLWGLILRNPEWRWEEDDDYADDDQDDDDIDEDHGDEDNDDEEALVKQQLCLSSPILILAIWFKFERLLFHTRHSPVIS